MDWYLIHTKPRQESRAALNLAQQGYQCYLPLMAVERLRQRALTLVLEPLFSRYLFIQLDTSHSGQNWGPIRSTKGVARIVTFVTALIHFVHPSLCQWHRRCMLTGQFITVTCPLIP